MKTELENWELCSIGLESSLRSGYSTAWSSIILPACNSYHMKFFDNLNYNITKIACKSEVEGCY